MIRKICSIPDKIYRCTWGDERELPVGSFYDLNRKTIPSIGATYYLSKPRYQNSKIDLIDNTPIDNVKLIANHVVQINDQFDVSIDDAFLYDIASNSLVGKNGKLKGSYIFSFIGKDSTLVRIDSPLYNQIIASNKRRKASKIKKKDFVKGGVYVTPGNNYAIYLGNVNTKYPSYHSSDKFSTYVKNNLMLFYDLRRTNKTKLNFNNLDIDALNAYSLDFKKTHSFTELSEKIEIPENCVSLIRELMVKKFKSELASFSESQIKHNLYYRFSSHCPSINMFEIGSNKDSFKEFDFNKYLTYL